MLAQKLYGALFNNVYVYKDGFPDWQARHGAPGRPEHFNCQLRDKARALGLHLDRRGHVATGCACDRGAAQQAQNVNRDRIFSQLILRREVGKNGRENSKEYGHP